MSLSPQDIEAQVFREKFKGYDQDEVDAFLDRVSDRITELLREREQLEERLARVEAEAAESIEAERLLKRTLITAQRTADETVAEAVAQANSTIAEGDQRANSVIADAEERAAQIIAEAERRAADVVGDARREVEARAAAADAQLTQVRQAVAQLQRFGAEYRERVRGAIAQQLALLDQAVDIPDVPAEVVRLGDDDEPRVEQRPAADAPPEPPVGGETPRVTADAGDGS